MKSAISFLLVIVLPSLVVIPVAHQKYLYKERNTNGQTLIRNFQFSADTAMALYKVNIAFQMILTLLKPCFPHSINSCSIYYSTLSLISV